jgi:AraC-like DNA-binding protein
VHPSPPDFELRAYGPQRIAAVVDTMAEDGVAPSAVLAGSNLDEATLRDPATRVSYRQIATVFGNAARLARAPAVALRAGARMHLTAYGMYGYALLSSPTRDDALDFAVKYLRAMGPIADFTYTRERDVGLFRYDPLLSPDPNDPLYRFSLAFTYAAHQTLSRDLYGVAFRFSDVRVAFAAPADAPAYADAFGCPVRFGEPVNELRVDAAWIERAPPLPDAVTHAMAREMCQQFLADLTRAGGYASMVRRALVERMPRCFPSIDAMARALSMAPRTLRRRLEAEGTSYRDLLADVRRGLAIEYLRKTRMTNEEIANRLGYSDAANFRHAFVRWTGKSPHEYRLG